MNFEDVEIKSLAIIRDKNGNQSLRVGFVPTPEGQVTTPPKDKHHTGQNPQQPQSKGKPIKAAWSNKIGRAIIIGAALGLVVETAITLLSL